MATDNIQLQAGDAITIALHALNLSDWVHRRVEELVYLDERSVRRRISIDLTVPAGVAARPGNPQRVVYLPVAQFAKRALTNFDFVSETGAPLPMLTARQNGELSVAVLSALARVPRPDIVDFIIDKYIRVLVFGTTEGSRSEALTKIFSTGTVIGRTLSQFPAFRALALDLSRNFMLYLPCRADEAGQRRIVKLAFDSPERAPTPSGLTERLGLRPVRDGFDVPAAGFAASYHVEVVPPPEMRVTEGSFLGQRERTVVSHHVPDPLGRIHLNLSGLDRASGLVRMSVRSASSLLSGIALAATLSAATLLFVRLRIDDFARTDNADAIVAALLTLPGLVVAYMARPGEHPIASAFLAGVRVVAMGSVLLSFAGAIVLFAGYESQQLKGIFTVLVSASALCAATLCTSWLAQRLQT